MKKKILVVLLIISLLVSIILSCKTVTAIIDAGAQIAGAAGIIDQNIADAISTSSRAFGNAWEEITPEQEYYVGRAVAANILTEYQIWNGSPNLTSYINRICMAITINSPRPELYNGYYAAILDSDEINAFATPGGHILITRGLINAARSEDALASVIAHEIAHIQLQHGIKAIKNNRILDAIRITGTEAVNVFGDTNLIELTGIFNDSVGEVFQTLVRNGYSREQELEADNIAMSLMASAGYNPSALIEMLNALPVSGTTGFSRTHPTPAQRVANAQRTVNDYRVTDTSSARRARFTAAMR